MALDARALRQQKEERRAFDALIDDMDDWVQSELAYLFSVLEEPDPHLDEDGLQAYAVRLDEQLQAGIDDVFRRAKTNLARARSRSVDLGADATRRLVEAELPTAAEVFRGRPDADRSH